MAVNEVKANANTKQTCRRRLQNNFDENDAKPAADRSVLSVISLNGNARKALRNGIDRLGKSLNSMRTTLGALTQKFRISTKRRQILEEDCMTPYCTTPQTFSKQLLGRTPTKMYSPFGIDTPQIPSIHRDNRNP